jgi:amino acid transporter
VRLRDVLTKSEPAGLIDTRGRALRCHNDGNVICLVNSNEERNQIAFYPRRHLPFECDTKNSGASLTLIDFLIGKPIATSEERAEQVGTSAGIPIFGLDALSSAAYGPEAALTLLIPLGLLGTAYIVPLIVSILILLVIVFFSYRQTIAAYPNGGGSYTVAHENLGTFPGLLAAAALMIDYVLTAAVGISAGIGALVSAAPSLQSKTLLLCLIALVLLTIANLRGQREAGGIFMFPTYLFLVCMFGMIAIGVLKVLLAGAGHPAPVVAPPAAPKALETVGLWILLKAFASGCTAMTGVEAVSNGVKAFREPTVRTAQRTLGIIIAALIVMLGGIAYLAQQYQVVATDPNARGYQSVLSMLLLAVSGRGWFYYVSIASVLLVLVFSANTAFADFPRVCRVIAEDGFLPLSFANRGRRLVYSEGIIVLAVITGILLTIFGGVTDRLIPLYAVGAFLAFTLSQAGMVAHWKRAGGHGALGNMFVNGLGALVTGITVLVVLVAKFMDGAWITAFMIPALLCLMYVVRRHYDYVRDQVKTDTPLDVSNLHEPLVIIPMPHWSRMAKYSLRMAFEISREIRVLHVAQEGKSDEFCRLWSHLVITPAAQADLPAPELIELNSPYRFVIAPIVDYVIKTAEENPGRRIVTIIPELVERRWYAYFLHAQRAALLKTMLLMKGNHRISVLNMPWYLK